MFAVFPPPAGMSLTKLSLAGNILIFNYSWPGRVWLVTSQLGTGKSITFFYSVPPHSLTASPNQGISEQTDILIMSFRTGVLSTVLERRRAAGIGLYRYRFFVYLVGQMSPLQSLPQTLTINVTKITCR
jgi:hypothetical protein